MPSLPTAAGIVEVAAGSIPPVAQHSSSSEAARSSSAGPGNELFWRAAASELGAVREAQPTPARLSSMVRLPSLPSLPTLPPTGLGVTHGFVAQPAASPSHHAAYRVGGGLKRFASGAEGAASFDGKENEGRGGSTGGKKLRVEEGRAGEGEAVTRWWKGAQRGSGCEEGEEGAASALMGLNGW